jgi:RHS repeat-associated protein
VTELDVTVPSGTVLDQSFTYGYIGGAPGPVDAGPNLDQVVDHRDSTQSRFCFYDDLDRLWKATNLAGTPLYSYLYDANGNRTQQTAPSGTTTYSYQTSTDRLTEAAGADARYYANDAYGNRIWAGPTAYGGTPSLIYDQSNRLVEARDPATQAVLGQYTYDAFGRRVRKVAGGETVLFFHDLAGQLLESRKPGTIPATVRDFVTLESEVVGVVDQGPSTPVTLSWIHGDQLGTPLAVTSAPGSGPSKVVWRAAYTPFGLATPNEDPDGDSAIFSLDLRFPGQLFDGESGLHDNFYRTYDPTVGRYLEADPLGQAGGLNLFAYVESDPINNVDPEGLQAVPMGVALPSAAAAAAVAPLPIPFPIPIPNIPAPPPLVWVGVAGGAGYWVGTQIEPYVSPIIWPYIEKLADECGDTPDCEAQYATETQTCNAIARRGGPGARRRAALCHESAVRRYGACRAGDPPSTWPPLIIWNN